MHWLFSLTCPAYGMHFCVYLIIIRQICWRLWRRGLDMAGQVELVIQIATFFGRYITRCFVRNKFIRK